MNERSTVGARLRRLRPRSETALLALLWIVTAGFLAKGFQLAPIWQGDYLNYWFAPRAYWSGINPYDVTAYREYGLAIFPEARGQQFNFTYPPPALFLFAPFAILPPYVAFAAWDVLSLAAFYFAARPLVPKAFPTFVAVLSPATLICLQFGQTGLLSSALFLMAMRGSGPAAALLTIKPHLGILVPPALLLRGRKAFLIALAATLLLVGLSALVIGHWGDFLDHVFAFQGRQLVDGSTYMWVIMGTTPMFGYGLKGLILYGIGAVIVLSRNFNIFTAATATFLISPYGFHYDMSAACLGFAVLLYSFWDRMPLWHKAVAGIAYLAPIIVSYGTWWVPPILLLGLFVQTQWFPGVRLTVKDRSITTENV